MTLPMVAWLPSASVGMLGRPWTERAQYWPPLMASWGTEMV